MALITDPDLLTATEVTIDTSAKTVLLNLAGNLSSDGVTLQCLYSYLKIKWTSDASLIKFPFPMQPITGEQFEWGVADGKFNGWKPLNDATRLLIRTAGWAEYSSAGVLNREYAGVITLGSIAGSDQVYYQNSGSGSATNIALTGPVNQAIQIFGDASNGNMNTRSYLRLFCRTQGKTHAFAQLSDIGVTNMTYQVYRFPVAVGADAKITIADVTIDGSAPYTGMSITWYGTAQQRSIGGTNRDFHVIIDGNNATAEQIYNFVQRQLRKSTDIDAGAGSKIGNVTNDLLQFVGDTLKTRSDSTGGVYIDNFQPADRNRLVFIDDSATERTFPFVAILTLQFGDNLQNDADAIYRVFFTNDLAATSPTGKDYGTASAVIVNDDSSNPMSGSVSAAASVSHTFAYDTNVQRGAGSEGEDAPITVVAIGKQTGQFVLATGTITRSISNVVSLASALERNYANP